MTFEEALTSGGDERIELKENGLNKYLVNPLKAEGVFNRGSCTCSGLSEDVRPQVELLYKQLEKGADLDRVRENQRLRIKAPLLENGKYRFDVFFSPSGSDLCFYPLLAATLYEPDKPIMNLITCPEELGTGSVIANRGLFFSEKTQVKTVQKGQPINDKLNIEVRTFPSRTPDGLIIDHKPLVSEAIERYKPTHNLIVNLVIGSKSGIENNISIIEDGPRDVIYCVDLCQMRAVPKLIHSLIELNCLIMITGSKFYQSPPFCGALLVPEKHSNRLKMAKPTDEQMKGFNEIYSKYDLPVDFENIRSKLSPIRNVGATLRWEAAICESEYLTRYTEREVTFAISLWNKYVIDYLRTKPIFELMRDQSKTNRSIISLMIKGKDGIFSHAKLKKLYERLLTTGHQYQSKYEKLTIGQPVEYESYSFIRLALGSRDVRKLIDTEIDLTDDYLLIDVLEKLAMDIDNEPD
ncbi:MAG: hypothetical protein Kow0075_10640 [Salibacteraceae bacterium]